MSLTHLAKAAVETLYGQSERMRQCAAEFKKDGEHGIGKSWFREAGDLAQKANRIKAWLETRNRSMK